MGQAEIPQRLPGGGMPIPRVVGRWNRVGLNRITRHIAPWMPGFGVVVHRGRRSGRRYLTPVNVFASEDGYVFALTYGPDTDWVKNVLAADRCELRTRGRTIQLVSPRLFHDQIRPTSARSNARYCGSSVSRTSCRSTSHLQRPDSPRSDHAEVRHPGNAMLDAPVTVAHMPTDLRDDHDLALRVVMEAELGDLRASGAAG
jgi:deazaflavin-dependent oxidoreductase (nitroreductase family)